MSKAVKKVESLIWKKRTENLASLRSRMKVREGDGVAKHFDTAAVLLNMGPELVSSSRINDIEHLLDAAFEMGLLIRSRDNRNVLLDILTAAC